MEEYTLRFLYYIIAVILFFIIVALVFLNCSQEGFSSSNVKLEYYSLSSCPHCLKFDPIWQNIHKQCKDNTIKYVVDKSKEAKDLAQQHKITSFPTIIITKDNKKIKEFNSSRTCESLKEFAKSNDIPCNFTC